MLQDGEVSISIVGAPTAGLVRIAVANEKTAMLSAGVYFDALEVRFGDIVCHYGSGKFLWRLTPSWSDVSFACWVVKNLARERNRGGGCDVRAPNPPTVRP